MAPPTITGDWLVLQFENGRLAYYPGVGWANDDIACTIRNTAARDTALTILQEAGFNGLVHGHVNYKLVGLKLAREQQSGAETESLEPCPA